MDPHQFYARWEARLAPADREQFLLELAALLSFEQARERRRLCTDARLYRQACAETAAELRRAGAVEAKKATA